MTGGEEAFVAWLRRQTASEGIGDDVAEIRARGRLVVTVDQQLEGTHFYPGLDLGTLGRRLLAVNLSDLAATGARPRWALLALGVPEETDPRPLVRGLLADAKRHGVQLIGGDVAHAPSLVSTLTLIGEKGPKDASLGRDRAKPGQILWLGGPVGESALGCELVVRGAAARGSSVTLPAPFPKKGGRAVAARRAVRRHLLPTAQLELGRWLASLGARAGAAIDVSDGLAKDLRRVCTASGAGAELDLRLLRDAVAPGHLELADALGVDPIAVALAGGEDYVLLFTLPEKVSPPARFGARPVGAVTRSKSVVFLDAAGDKHPLPHLGWDHLS